MIETPTFRTDADRLWTEDERLEFIVNDPGKIADDASGEEICRKLLQAVREMKSSQAARVTEIQANEVAEARHLTGLSQAQFAEVLGISKRTLQEWEQGRRSPSGAARTLIHIARRHPEVLRETHASG